MYKDSIWAKEIIARQNREGSWGFFHTLSEPRKYPITTEQALRRLQNLGYTIYDEPIEKAVSYMSDCLAGKKQIPDRREKLHDWDIFTNLMSVSYTHLDVYKRQLFDFPFRSNSHKPQKCCHHG